MKRLMGTKEEGTEKVGREEGIGRERRETDKMICRCLAVSYDACTRFAHAYAWAAEVFSQALIMLKQTAELQLGHGWLWA